MFILILVFIIITTISVMFYLTKANKPVPKQSLMQINFDTEKDLPSKITYPKPITNERGLIICPPYHDEDKLLDIKIMVKKENSIDNNKILWHVNKDVVNRDIIIDCFYSEDLLTWKHTSLYKIVINMNIHYIRYTGEASSKFAKEIYEVLNKKSNNTWYVK